MQPSAESSQLSFGEDIKVAKPKKPVPTAQLIQEVVEKSIKLKESEKKKQSEAQELFKAKQGAPKGGN